MTTHATSLLHIQGASQESIQLFDGDLSLVSWSIHLHDSLWKLPHSHQHSHLHTASELLRHLLEVWKKRSSELSYCTTQTPLPTLNQQHSTALQYIQHFLSSLCQLKRASSVLQPPSPSRCTGQLWLWVLALTHQLAQGKQHTHKTQGCSYLLRLWQLVRDMDEQMNEYMNRGMNQRCERLGWKKWMARQA